VKGLVPLWLKNILDTMNTKFLFAFVVITFFYISGNVCAQKYGLFKIYGKMILFADSLNDKNSADWQIEQIKNNSNPKRLTLLDDYNLAICYIAKNNIDSACFHIKKTIPKLPIDMNRMILSDTDFDRLHSLTCWKEITDKIDSVYLKTIPTVQNPKLAVELFHIFERDQHARGYGLKCLDKHFVNVDSVNIIRVEEIIKEYGWPTYSMVGKVAANGAFLIIQHSNTRIQKKYLDQLLDAAKKKEASSESVALLQDRIMTKESHYQIYGTQVFQIKDKVTGKLSKYTYYPIKDEKNVDARRKEMGLIPLKDYLKKFDIDYVPGTEFQPPAF
jgi:hypothetical protein